MTPSDTLRVAADRLCAREVQLFILRGDEYESEFDPAPLAAWLRVEAVSSEPTHSALSFARAILGGRP